jgi:hypothetical protein
MSTSGGTDVFTACGFFAVHLVDKGFWVFFSQL